MSAPLCTTAHHGYILFFLWIRRWCRVTEVLLEGTGWCKESVKQITKFICSNKITSLRQWDSLWECKVSVHWHEISCYLIVTVLMCACVHWVCSLLSLLIVLSCHIVTAFILFEKQKNCNLRKLQTCAHYAYSIHGSIFWYCLNTVTFYRWSLVEIGDNIALGLISAQKKQVFFETGNSKWALPSHFLELARFISLSV